MLKFYLWNVPGLSLLIPAKSGILYATQTGGHACLEQTVEGWILPLYNSCEAVDQEQSLRTHFVSKWRGWCSDGIDATTADFVDEILRATPHTHWLRVDRSRLADSHESWVYVQPSELRDTEIIEWHDFVFTNGVVTWTNSD